MDYTPATIALPAHIRKVAVRPFDNGTPVHGVENRLALAVADEFIRDGRVKLARDEASADGVVTGDIARYIKEPLSYDADNVAREYKLWIVMDVRFLDQVNKTVLWEEPRLEHDLQYTVETLPGGKTEDEARDELWRLFARDIVKRTILGFGSVSGASERKIKSHPSGERPH